MSGLRKITGIVMVIFVVALLGWDLFVAIEPTQGDTISEIMRDYSAGHPLIPTSIGVLSGHFFWPKKERINGVWTAVLLSVVGLSLLLSGFIFSLNWPPMYPFIGGVLIGHLVWAQTPAKR